MVFDRQRTSDIGKRRKLYRSTGSNGFGRREAVGALQNQKPAGNDHRILQTGVCMTNGLRDPQSQPVRKNILKIVYASQ